MSHPPSKHHPNSPNGQDEQLHNLSGNLPLVALLELRLSRRSVLKGGFGLAASCFIQPALASTPAPATPPDPQPLRLGFSAVAKHTQDRLTLPAGYQARVLYRTGDPLNRLADDYKNDGSDSAESFNHRAGDHHDGMHYFGLDSTGQGRDMSNPHRGLLAINHEYINSRFLHTQQEVAAGLSSARRASCAQIDKEVNAHGVSIVEVWWQQEQFQINRDSPFSRRITASTPMLLNGPARGNELLVTRYSPDGTGTRGTLNNCSNGYTPWGTYLSCEENWAGYFKRPASETLDGKARLAQERYFGNKESNGSHGWANPPEGTSDEQGLYARWDLSPGKDPKNDYRYAANTMGWVVEIDPFSLDAIPRKRTAMGRIAHEGAMPAKVEAGKPLVYYMGDDARGEYIYKFVSTRLWDPADASPGGITIGDKYLDDGILYVARFNANGHGQWHELTISNPLIANYAPYPFANQTDVLVHSRVAADAVGATPMDRPEWAGVHPITGEVYITLTNNSLRGSQYPVDPANPRSYDDGEGNRGNPNGHIIRLREKDNDPATTAFQWDIYLFGAEAALASKEINLSALVEENDFSSPDGLWFSQARPGLMWLQTDDAAFTGVSNCMMLAAIPGKVDDGGRRKLSHPALSGSTGMGTTVNTPVGKPATTATLRRFLVGPCDCEITGICEAPDGRTLFVNIQHPGEGTPTAAVANQISSQFTSHWPPAGDDATGLPDINVRPRSATVVIRRIDGGLIGN